MVEAITVREYEDAERLMASGEARGGLLVHAAVSAVVCVALILINVFAFPQFPWSPFPVVGMGIGVLAHYVFGVRRLEAAMRTHQSAVEHRALELKSA